MKQLIFQKKENQRLRKDMEEKKREAEEMKAFDENTAKNGDQSRINLQSRVGAARLQSGLSKGKQSQNNLSGLNNSRRNISLVSANVFIGHGRPKTAAMGGGGLPRPPTAY